MHPNPAFRKTPNEINIEFARARGFGVLAVNAGGGPLLSHVPFRLSGDGSCFEAHLVRSNPIVRLLDKPVRAVMAVSGGDAYVSPDWYDLLDQVPTWNYVAVHLRGELSLLDQDELHGILERLSAAMENRIAGKKPWSIGKMDQDAYARMLRQIVPVAMRIDEVQGTWKLSQNKPSEAREGAARGVGEARIGTEIDAMVEWMNAVPRD